MKLHLWSFIHSNGVANDNFSLNYVFNCVNFFLDPEDIRCLGLGAQSGTLLKGTGCPLTGIRLWGTKGLPKGLRASG